ncbi:MAG: BNR repeat-containing protein [Burkholderiaceae bacterium]
MTVLDLGPAWAGNTVNDVVFRHHGLLTRDRLQFAAFYRDERNLRLVRRDLDSGALQTFDLQGQYRLQDAHNSISLGIDRQGHLHLIYDQHDTRLRYRRSTRPLSVAGWTGELPMSGQHEQQVTYPTFIVQPGGRPLLLLYRDGKAECGVARLKEYAETGVWFDREAPILSGARQQPWTSNPYWNHPAIGRDGSLHLSFVWRSHLLGPEQRVNNLGIDYARSPDQGRSWLTSRGRPLRTPVTQVNSETVLAVSPGSNLINQTSMALDGGDRPHIAFYADDFDGVPQYQHLWFDGRQWRHQIVSQRRTPFLLTGRGTLQIPISRPEIVIDEQDRVYLIYRGDLSGERLVAQRLLPPHYEPQPADVRPLWPEPVGFAEPVIDRLRWLQQRVLSLQVHNCGQPPNEGAATAHYEALRIVDVRLPALFEDAPAAT